MGVRAKPARACPEPGGKVRLPRTVEKEMVNSLPENRPGITERAFSRSRWIKSAVVSPPTRRSFLATSAAAGVLGLTASSKAQTISVADRLGYANGWLNSPPLTAADLGGKVVIIDF